MLGNSPTPITMLNKIFIFIISLCMYSMYSFVLKFALMHHFNLNNIRMLNIKVSVLIVSNVNYF